ncbi:MAG: hypothetical protein JST12_18085 [Armatimonadetes bacterium]|nr:hypothetical protein [Armatimonadota bacterium]
MSAVTPTAAVQPFSAVPAPMTPADTPTIAAVAIDAVTTTICAATISSGLLATYLSKDVNDHAVRLDIMGRGGSSAGIVRGLDLSGDTTSLTLTVAAGQAYAPALLEVDAQTTTMTASATNQVWLLSNGTIASGTGGYVPGSYGIFLGTVTTDGTGITAIDFSGVFYFSGGLPWRASADGFRPTDSPTCPFMFLARTFGGFWLWDGSRYLFLEDRRGTVSLTDAATIATNAASGDVFTVVLGGNRTLGEPTNPREGQRCMWLFQQDATGSRTLTLDASFKVPSSLTVTLSTAASTTDVLEARYSSFVSGWIVTNFQTGI